MYRFLEKNSFLSEKTEDEIKTIDYRFFKGLKSAHKSYDNLTGRKTHQDYLYEDSEGNVHLSIRQFYEDILDEEDTVIDIKAITYWFKIAKEFGEHTKKEECLKLSTKDVEDMLRVRRARVKQYLIKEGSTAESPVVQQVFAILLIWLNTEVETWVNTANASFVINKLDNAPTTDEPLILDIFGGVENTPRSYADLMSLPTETQGTVINYLKYYIK